MSAQLSQRKIILIGGPTASGKSALAMQIARQNQGYIINADAMQIYAGLNLLTAQPDPQDKAEIPHFLYEVTDAAQASSAGKWLTQAQDAIAQVQAMGRTPILVGGTGMYFQALLGGLAEIPPIPDEARAEAEKLYNEYGEEKFRANLAQHDPASASRIARNDRQRLIRAYEVVIHTGKSLAEWHKKAPHHAHHRHPVLRHGIQRPASAGQKSFDAQTRFLDTGLSRYDASGHANQILPESLIYEKHLLMPERDALYAACDKRFMSMVERGAIEEVKNLMQRNLLPSLPAMKILGVREIASYLRKEISLETAIEKAQQATRNYAKRQMTWFRNQW